MRSQASGAKEGRGGATPRVASKPAEETGKCVLPASCVLRTMVPRGAMYYAMQ